MCKVLIAKGEGCIHITCPVCDYEWCWVCGGEFGEVHRLKCKGFWQPRSPEKRSEPMPLVKYGVCLEISFWVMCLIMYYSDELEISYEPMLLGVLSLFTILLFFGVCWWWCYGVPCLLLAFNKILGI